MLPQKCISYEELLYVYKMSIMLVMPTLFESVSIQIYELLFLKVPVCASNVVALTEQVGVQVYCLILMMSMIWLKKFLFC